MRSHTKFGPQSFRRFYVIGCKQTNRQNRQTRKVCTYMKAAVFSFYVLKPSFLLEIAWMFDHLCKLKLSAFLSINFINLYFH